MSDSLLPHNATPQERALEQVACLRLAPQLPLQILWDPDRCPEEFLPWLAYAFSVDVWNPHWPEEIKREVIKNSFEIHRGKGTRKAVVAALSAIGFNVDLSEWFEYGGEPHTFRLDAYSADIVAAGHELNQGLFDGVSSLVEYTKPARSHFTLRLGQSFHASAKTRFGVRGRVLVEDQTTPEVPGRSVFSEITPRLKVSGMSRVLGFPAPATPPRAIQTNAKTRVALKAKAIVRDLVTFHVPEGAAYHVA